MASMRIKDLIHETNPLKRKLPGLSFESKPKRALPEFDYKTFFASLNLPVEHPLPCITNRERLSEWLTEKFPTQTKNTVFVTQYIAYITAGQMTIRVFDTEKMIFSLMRAIHENSQHFFLMISIIHLMSHIGKFRPEFYAQAVDKGLMFPVLNLIEKWGFDNLLVTEISLLLSDCIKHFTNHCPIMNERLLKEIKRSSVSLLVNISSIDNFVNLLNLNK